MTTTLDQLADGLYAEQPDRPLFHYTSITAMRSIVSEGCLWATDLRYMSDASELRHLAETIHFNIVGLQGLEGYEVLEQFDRWVTNRLNGGYIVCAAAFSAQGDLLSQ